jgi:hypothetical protein
MNFRISSPSNIKAPVIRQGLLQFRREANICRCEISIAGGNPHLNSKSKTIAFIGVLSKHSFLKERIFLHGFQYNVSIGNKEALYIIIYKIDPAC